MNFGKAVKPALNFGQSRKQESGTILNKLPGRQTELYGREDTGFAPPQN